MNIFRPFHRSQVSKPAGFTLVELLITMGLLSIFMLIITDIFVAVADVRTESEATSSVSEDSRFIIARLSYDIQRASAVTTPAALGGSSSSLGLTIGGQAYTYAVASNDLQLTSPLGVDTINSSETTISGLSLQKLGNASGKETIRLTLTITSKAQPDQGMTSKTLTTTVGRR